jgi:hypothetical protein
MSDFVTSGSRQVMSHFARRFIMSIFAGLARNAVGGGLDHES